MRVAVKGLFQTKPDPWDGLPAAGAGRPQVKVRVFAPSASGARMLAATGCGATIVLFVVGMTLAVGLGRLLG